MFLNSEACKSDAQDADYPLWYTVSKPQNTFFRIRQKLIRSIDHKGMIIGAKIST